VVMGKVSCTPGVEETNPTISTDPVRPTDSESVMHQCQKEFSWELGVMHPTIK